MINGGLNMQLPCYNGLLNREGNIENIFILLCLVHLPHILVKSLFELVYITI